ncbi:MAG: LD-carboxypeptidase [Chloroflexota bacterium]
MIEANLLRSPRLRSGDLVRLLSPASYPTSAAIDAYIKVLEDWGLRCDVGVHALDKFGYMAGSDAERLADLNDAFRNPQVRAIITTRGGAGAYRIADDIDFAAVRADPKPIVGFSDITYLHLSLLTRCQLGSIHGCLVGAKAVASVKQLLMSAEPITLCREPAAVSAAVQFAGKARGRLIGGNLPALATSIGVRMPSLSGAILFLEAHRVAGLGMVDRHLTQLLRSGVLDGVVGVALGSFEGFRDFADRGWTIIDVLKDRLGQLGVPVLGGLDAGHNLSDANGRPDQTAMPLGSLATLDVAAGTLTIDPIVY